MALAAAVICQSLTTRVRLCRASFTVRLCQSLAVADSGRRFFELGADCQTLRPGDGLPA